MTFVKGCGGQIFCRWHFRSRFQSVMNCLQGWISQAKSILPCLRWKYNKNLDWHCDLTEIYFNLFAIIAQRQLLGMVDLSSFGFLHMLKWCTLGCNQDNTLDIKSLDGGVFLCQWEIRSLPLFEINDPLLQKWLLILSGKSATLNFVNRR